MAVQGTARTRDGPRGSSGDGHAPQPTDAGPWSRPTGRSHSHRSGPRLRPARRALPREWASRPHRSASAAQRLSSSHPAAHPPIVLFNPRITDCCDETDEHYEGCLSFFDVRGLVPRPVKITVETETRTGETVTTEYARGLARLVHHEIDHLSGLLCTVRMRTGVDPIPVEQYRQTGQGSVGWATLRCTATRPRNFCGRPGPSGSELSTADSTSEGRHSRKEVAALGARCSVPQAPSERRPRPRCRSTARTRAGAAAAGSGRSRACACSRSRSRSGPT
ncbi:peptide deformylase [Streptomyces microflavus]|uniref:peptide deformylase n=1 Tax=Streptomyces microflavus TaxID=1919 RepID=UPI0037CDDFE3